MKRLSVGWIILTLTIPIFSSCSSNGAQNTSTQANTTSGTVASTTASSTAATIAATQPAPKPKELMAEVDKMPVSAMIGEDELYEISDPDVIAQLSEIIPDSQLYLSRSTSSNNAKEAEVYQAVIPFNRFLEQSIKEADKFEGIYGNVKDIGALVKMLQKDPQVIAKLGYAAKSITKVMNIASLVKGDFAMHEITQNLEEINTNVTKISDFQQREFKSRILATLSGVKEISKFSYEILSSEEQRKRKSDTLENLKGNATQLIEQVNINITDLSQKSFTKFKDYEQQIVEYDLLIEYQNLLTQIMEEISTLDFLLANGSSSKELSYSTFNDHLKNSMQARTAMSTWHTKHIQAFEIELDNKRMSKKGFEGVASAVPGVFDKNWHYKALDDNFVQTVRKQLEVPEYTPNEPSEFYNEDLVVVIKDGKYYYLTAQNNQ